MGHVALSCRISVDKSGRAESVEAQERWGREYAAVTWPGVPVVVYADNDISAANGDHRPGYERLRQAIREGQVAHLWCVEQSRLERREIGWFELAAELLHVGITEFHTRREGIVRVGDVVAGIKAVINAHEVRQMKGRLMDKLDENAGQGRPPGSRPFGLAHAVNEAGEKTYVHVPEQADAIRWAAEKVLAGWSLSHVAAALREQGLHGPHRVKVRDDDGKVVTDEHGRPVTRPSTLTPGSVKSMLTNPTIAGHRIHRGVDVGKGNWAPILDEATWQAVRAKLSAPRTVDRVDGRTYPVTPANGSFPGREYVLTGGLARCGVCGAALIGSKKQMGKKAGQPAKRVVKYLLCHPKTGGKGCVGIMLEPTEQHVVDSLFAELDKPEFLDLVAADDDAARREEITRLLARLDGQRLELAGMWSDEQLTSDEWLAAKQGIDGRERKLRAELAAKPPPPARVSIEQAREAWPDMELDEQRQFVRLFIERVTIHRATPGLQRFDPNRVSITWRVQR